MVGFEEWFGEMVKKGGVVGTVVVGDVGFGENRVSWAGDAGGS